MLKTVNFHVLRHQFTKQFIFRIFSMYILIGNLFLRGNINKLSFIRKVFSWMLWPVPQNIIIMSWTTRTMEHHRTTCKARKIHQRWIKCKHFNGFWFRPACLDFNHHLQVNWRLQFKKILFKIINFYVLCPVFSILSTCVFILISHLTFRTLEFVEVGSKSYSHISSQSYIVSGFCGIEENVELGHDQISNQNHPLNLT